MVHMPISYDVKLCTPEQYKICADVALDYLVKEDNSACVCGTPCDLTKYSLTTSSFRLPSTFGASYYAEKYNRTEEYVTRNFAKLNVFFEALRGYHQSVIIN